MASCRCVDQSLFLGERQVRIYLPQILFRVISIPHGHLGRVKHPPAERGAGGFEVRLEGMMGISFNRDPEEAAAGPIVFSRKPRPAASGGERVASQHSAQRARRRKLPKVLGKIGAVQRQLPLGRG